MSSSRRFALLGGNVSYTKSPDIFAAIGTYLKWDIGFDIFDVRQNDVPSALSRMRDGWIDGLSVTIPHKETVLAFLDRYSPDAEAIGAVNCVVRDEDKLIGCNTDWTGFIEPLSPLKERLADQRVLIVGSGGAARAAIYGLCALTQVREFVVVSRNLGRSRTLKAAVGRTPVRESAFDHISEWRSTINDFTLIVNATPLGGPNHPDGGVLASVMRLRTETLYYDLNYNDDNQLVQQAQAAGATVIDGRQMLVRQAIQSFKLWTGLSVPFQQIYESVFSDRRR